MFRREAACIADLIATGVDAKANPAPRCHSKGEVADIAADIDAGQRTVWQSSRKHCESLLAGPAVWPAVVWREWIGLVAARHVDGALDGELRPLQGFLYPVHHSAGQATSVV